MLVFIDETGDHNLIQIDIEYPIFALGALMIDEEEYAKLDLAVKNLKVRFFSDDGTFILHSSELKRPGHKKTDPRNKVMTDPAVRAGFYQAFEDDVMKAIDFKLIICLIQKESLTKHYHYPADPYHFCFENLLNRIIRHGDGSNTIYSEKRGPVLDTELEAEYEKRKKVGIRFHSAEDVSKKTSLELIDKKLNVNGLQVIDLIMGCYAKQYLGKKHKMVGNDITPETVFSKLICSVTKFP